MFIFSFFYLLPVKMGCGTSCSHRRVGNAEPYDARRLLTELVTVQTAIVLNEDFSTGRERLFSPAQYGDDRGLTLNSQKLPEKDEPNISAVDGSKVSETRRHSFECTFSSSTCYGLPGYVESTGDNVKVGTQRVTDLSQEIETSLKRNSLSEQVTAESAFKMPSIQEMSEMGNKIKP